MKNFGFDQSEKKVNNTKFLNISQDSIIMRRNIYLIIKYDSQDKKKQTIVVCGKGHYD